MREIVFIHYHFFGGGVSDLILETAKGITQSKEHQDVSVVIAGDLLQENINGCLSQNPRVKLKCIKEFDYSYGLDEISYNSLRKEIFNKLMALVDTSKNQSFVFHNYQIGLNPAFTSAVIDFCLTESVDVLLYIHDFAENSRWKLYSYLKRFEKRSLYPQRGRIKYITTTNTDAERLKSAGVNSVYTIYNFHRDIFSFNRDNEAIEKSFLEVKNHCVDNGFSFEKDSPIALYPVRTVRRKNILEAAFLSKKLKTNLIVTLGSCGQAEDAEYERLVNSAYAQKLVSGSIGLGAKIPLFLESCIKADPLFLSSSFMEGFGLIYTIAYLTNQKFLSRSIYSFEELKESFPMECGSLYKSVRVEIPKSEKVRLFLLYKRVLKKNIEMGSLVERGIELIEKEIFNKDGADFSFLSPELQYQILKESREAVVEPEINFDANGIKTSEANIFSNINKEFFLVERYVSDLMRVIETPLSGVANTKSNVDDEILESFVINESFRLLSF